MIWFYLFINDYIEAYERTQQHVSRDNNFNVKFQIKTTLWRKLCVCVSWRYPVQKFGFENEGQAQGVKNGTSTIQFQMLTNWRLSSDFVIQIRWPLLCVGVTMQFGIDFSSQFDNSILNSILNCPGIRSVYRNPHILFTSLILL